MQRVDFFFLIKVFFLNIAFKNINLFKLKLHFIISCNVLCYYSTYYISYKSINILKKIYFKEF